MWLLAGQVDYRSGAIHFCRFQSEFGPLVDCATAHPDGIFQKYFVGEYGAESGWSDFFDF